MLNRFFGLHQRQTSVRTECIAGLTTFFTMAYIIFVNPAILSQAGMAKDAVIAVTCFVAAAATIATGLFANAPVAMAPGMGLNAFFAFTLVMTRQISWQTALGVVFLSGLLFLILTAVGFRRKLLEAIPQSLISSISVGIGLFITFIGLQNLGLVKSDPVTFVAAAGLNRTILTGLAGLVVMVFLEMKRVPGALLLGILFSTLLAILLGDVKPPQQIIATQFHLSELFFKMDIIGTFKWGLFSSIFTLMFIDMFDSIGTLLAVAPQAGLTEKDGTIRGLDRLLMIDAAATMFGAVCGASTTTSYIESAAGVEQGGRTGLTSVVTGFLFLLSMLFVPVVGIVPKYATAPALLMVGLFMMKEIRLIEFSDMRQGLPAFVIIVMIAMSYSISTGLAFGFIAFVLMEIMSGNIAKIKPAMWLITALSIFYFCV